MPKATITIVGLGKRGSSIGLALSKPELDFDLIGHDKDSGVAKEARSKGSVKSVPWNLISACESADLVILAIPFDQVKSTLKALGPELKPGCVVIDTSPFKQPVIEWADEYLREGIHFVGIGLGINPEVMYDQKSGPEAANGELFANSPCCIMPSPNCLPEAVKTAQDIAHLLGAEPYFLDPVEYDGMATATNLLPALFAGVLLGSLSSSPGWREMRRLSSLSLLNFTQPLEEGGPGLARAAMLNKENVLYWLDTTMESLRSTRSQIDEENEDVLAALLGNHLEQRDEWVASWMLNKWDKSSTSSELPTSGGIFGQLLGFRKPGKRDKD